MTKKGWIILGGLLLANLVVFGVLAYLFLSSPPSSLVSPLSSPPSPSPASPLTAATEGAAAGRAATVKALYPLALEVATAWQGDARLASASADWPRPTAEALEDQEVLWSFNFYSPAARKVYAVAVSEGQARGIRESQVPRDLNPAPVEGWQIDSPAALATWLANGGSEFLARYQQAQVRARLRFPSDSPTPLWMVWGSDEQSSANFMLKIDAASGIIVE
jgi:hypothetical protein